MTQDLIQSFMLKNGECFDPYQISTIQKALSEIDDSKALPILGLSFQKPTLILIIAILLGWERFFLDDIALGVVKIITCYGCGIWWLVDIFSAKRRANEYNMRKFNEAILMCR